MSETRSHPLRMLKLAVRRPLLLHPAEMRFRIPLEVSNPGLLLTTLRHHAHLRLYVVPSAVGFAVPLGIADAVASARAGHVQWVELELGVHGDPGCGEPDRPV